MSQSIDQQLDDQMARMSVDDSSRALVVVQPSVAEAQPPIPPAPAPVQLPPYDELLGYDIEQIKESITPLLTDIHYKSINRLLRLIGILGSTIYIRCQAYSLIEDNITPSARKGLLLNVIYNYIPRSRNRINERFVPY